MKWKLLNEEKNHQIYTFQKENIEYYFKVATTEEIAKTLLASEIAAWMGIKTQKFKATIINEKQGLLSPNYNPNHKKEIKLVEVLAKFYEEIILENENDFQDEYFIEKTQNLETIWWALEHYYQKHKNKSLIVKSLMSELVDFFMLQITIGDIDLHFENISILDGEKPSLANYFDYDKCYEASYYSKEGGAFLLETYPHFQGKKAEYTVQSFLSSSNEEVINLLKKRIANIPPLEMIWEKIEKEQEFQIPKKLKEKYMQIQNSYFLAIQTMIEEHQHKITK